MTTKRVESTWKKVYALGSSDNELDFAYAQIIATAMDTRIRLGITQKALAEKSGLSSGMISNIEAGRSVPTLKTFLKYIRGLNLDWEFVYGSLSEVFKGLERLCKRGSERIRTLVHTYRKN